MLGGCKGARPHTGARQQPASTALAAPTWCGGGVACLLQQRGVAGAPAPPPLELSHLPVSTSCAWGGRRPTRPQTGLCAPQTAPLTIHKYFGGGSRAPAVHPCAQNARRRHRPWKSVREGSWASCTAAGLHSDPAPSVAGLRGMEGSGRLCKRKDVQEVRQRGGKRAQEAPQGSTPGECAYVPLQVESPATASWPQRRKRQAGPVDAWLVLAPGSNAHPAEPRKQSAQKPPRVNGPECLGSCSRETGSLPPRECLPPQNPLTSRATRGCSPWPRPWPSV